MAHEAWDVFVEDQPWLLPDGARVVVGESSLAGARPGIPLVSELIERATTTPVSIDDEDFELLTWDRSGGSTISWLCPLPSAVRPTGLYTEHERVLAHFGGVVERSLDEPSTWLLNCNNALTERESSVDASFLDDYLWMMEHHGGSWPIDPTSYYSICREANGNTTLCNRDDGSIVLFAPDHGFEHVVPLTGCPPYSLYRIPAAPNFAKWVNAIATQWLSVIA